MVTESVDEFYRSFLEQILIDIDVYDVTDYLNNKTNSNNVPKTQLRPSRSAKNIERTLLWSNHGDSAETKKRTPRQRPDTRS